MGVNPSAIVDEYLDHERRRNNLIVHNLEEPSEQIPVGSSKLDSAKLAHLFQTEFALGILSYLSAFVKVKYPRPDLDQF